MSVTPSTAPRSLVVETTSSGSPEVDRLLELCTQQGKQIEELRAEVTCLRQEMKNFETTRQATGELLSVLQRYAATKELGIEAAISNDDQRSCEKIEDLLNRGADIHECGMISATRHCSSLHTMIARGLVNMVATVMAHEKPVDLTVLDISGYSPLHVLASACPENDMAVKMMLEGILTRLRPNDRGLTTVVDWHLESNDASGKRLDFLSLAAVHGRLSVFIPTLCNRGFEDSWNAPISLKVVPQTKDWKQLDDRFKDLFAYYATVREGETEEKDTLELLTQLESCCGLPDAERLKQLQMRIRRGADVMYFNSYGDAPTLYYCIQQGSLEVVNALLESPRPIDWTIPAANGWTLLHYAAARCSCPSTPWYTVLTPPHTHSTYPSDPYEDRTVKEVYALLNLLLDRIRDHPDDIVDWGRKDVEGHEPISVAAGWGSLAAFVNVLFRESGPLYFRRRGVIPITQRARRSDVNSLLQADRRRLRFVNGVGEK